MVKGEGYSKTKYGQTGTSGILKVMGSEVTVTADLPDEGIPVIGSLSTLI